MKAAKSINDERKSARNAKIAEIVANEDCLYTKAELETFSDSVLDRTLEMLEPAPYRAAAGVKSGSDASKVPAPPAILLAKPDADAVGETTRRAKMGKR